MEAARKSSIAARDSASVLPVSYTHLTYTNDKGFTVRITETREYDHVAQVLVYNLYRRWKEDGVEKERVTHIAIRYTFPQELNALLERSGFQILHQYGNWDKSPLTKDSPAIISVCKLA